LVDAYFPNSGIISLVMRLNTGDTTEVAMVGRDSMFGALPLPVINEDRRFLYPACPKQQALPLAAVWKHFGGVPQLHGPKLKLILDGTIGGHLISDRCGASDPSPGDAFPRYSQCNSRT
jgi:hypothetical protein